MQLHRLRQHLCCATTPIAVRSANLIADAGAEVRSLDQRDRKVGLFGDWLETSGHGKYVEWVQDKETALYSLEVVREENGARERARSDSHTD